MRAKQRAHSRPGDSGSMSVTAAGGRQKGAGQRPRSLSVR